MGCDNATPRRVFVPMARHLAALKRDLELNCGFMGRLAPLMSPMALGRQQANELSAARHQKSGCQAGVIRAKNPSGEIDPNESRTRNI